MSEQDELLTPEEIMAFSKKRAMFPEDWCKAQLAKVHIDEEKIRKQEMERITAILEKEYPAITTWQCWQALKGEK